MGVLQEARGDQGLACWRELRFGLAQSFRRRGCLPEKWLAQETRSFLIIRLAICFPASCQTNANASLAHAPAISRCLASTDTVGPRGQTHLALAHRRGCRRGLTQPFTVRPAQPFTVRPRAAQC